MNLASYLEQQAMKPSQFAKQLGVPASTVGRIISGARRPRIDTAAKIEAATGGAVSMSDLLVERLADAAPEPSSPAAPSASRGKDAALTTEVAP